MESLHSKQNRIFWKLRNALQFKRGGYREVGESKAADSENLLAEKYSLRSSSLSKEVWQKNLATLWGLEQFPLPLQPLTILEPGCQDFSRLPALRAFFPASQIMGVEVDAFPILHNLHSRWDKAHYYISLTNNARYFAQDFFAWNKPADLILSFYPFVSEHPTLAWGLPVDFADGKKWAEAYVKNLNPNGHLLVVHQGKWEEDIFDENRKGLPLAIVKRTVLDCPFYPLPHPAHATLYRLEN